MIVAVVTQHDLLSALIIVALVAGFVWIVRR